MAIAEGRDKFWNPVTDSVEMFLLRFSLPTIEVSYLKYLGQMAIIGGISFVGEALNHLLPLPIPGSIYGLVIMLLGLVTKVIPLKAVKSTGNFLISIMPIMFIGPTVGLMASYDVYKSFIIPFVLISLISTVAVMAVTGRTAQFIIRISARMKNKHPEKSSGRNRKEGGER